jgi:hypothetical protein
LTKASRIRLVIESVFSTLKRQIRLETHLAKTPGGLVQRIAQRLLALTLGVYVNILIGRPPRAAKRLGQMATLTPPSRISPDHPTHYELGSSAPVREASID